MDQLSSIASISSRMKRGETLIDFQKRIALQNVSDPDPPGWASFLLGTHPTAMERIGQALAFKDRAEEPRGGS